MSLDDNWEASGLVGKLAAGRYLIVSELATDNRRTLYEAENVELGVRVTLGVIRADGTPTEQRLRNGEKLRSLSQAALVSVLDVGKLDSGELFVATERPQGTTLRALANGKRLEQRRALLIIRQVLEALVAAHGVGAIHGDVKPENILILPGLIADRVKLTDFGVATLTGSPRAGDPVYSAPETALGTIDARADLYSVGAVLFELLTGHPPFFADDATALRRLHAYAPMQSLKQRAPELSFAELLEKLVSTALAKKLDVRFQSATDMLAALDSALQSIEEAPAPQPASGRNRKPNDSLLLLAQDLMPQPRPVEPAVAEPVVPVNIGREVPQLSFAARAELTLRRGSLRAHEIVDKLALGTRFAKLGRTRKQILAGVVGAVLLGLVLALVTCRGAKPKQVDIAQRAEALVEEGKGAEAIELIKRDIAAHHGNARAYLALGETQHALGHDAQALIAYENAIAATPAVANQPQLVDNLSQLARSPDVAIALGALELIALRCGATGNDAIALHASTNPHGDVRHRASVLAERAGISNQIDVVQSGSLDLEQAATCDARRAAITKLAKTEDPRALPALRKAKAFKCVERDVAAAIQRVSAPANHR